MTDDLVQRLRRTYRKEYAPTGSMIGVISNRLRPFPILAADVLFNPDGREAADRIEALEAENGRLREALKRIQHFSPAHMWRAPDIKVIISAALQEQSK